MMRMDNVQGNIDPRLAAAVQALPKIELHRHFEASMRLDTLIEVAREYNITMPDYESDNLRPFVQMMPDEPRNMQHFLNKFHTIRQFYCSNDVIERMSREIVIDAAADNVKYMELRFTPAALCNVTGASANEVVGLVCDTVAQTAREHDIDVRLIVSMNRHEPIAVGEEALRAAIDYKHKGIVAVDLAGQETGFPATLFRGLFKEAKEEGLFVTIHAGEWQGADSVWDAIGNLNADRIGHGIRLLEDPGILNIVIERQIALEVCPSSNVLSGVVPSLADHPLVPLTQQEVCTTLNTDDPLVCNVTLSDEMLNAIQYMDLTLEDLKSFTLRAASAAFLPQGERDTLITRFERLLAEHAFPN